MHLWLVKEIIEYLDIFNGYPFGYFQGDFLQSLHGQMFPISQEDQYIYRNTDTKMSQIEEEEKTWNIKQLKADFVHVVLTWGETSSGTTKVRNSGLGPDPDLCAKSGPE